MNILAIESSCDETAVAIVRDGREVLTDCIASQVELHRIYGGVVPEIASRKHIEAIYGLADQALLTAGMTRGDIDAVAVTYAPGLIGAVLVGVNFAKAAALALNKPLIPVHHIRGHIAANYIAYPELKPPFLCLVVSGGHTMIIDLRATVLEPIGKRRCFSIPVVQTHSLGAPFKIVHSVFLLKRHQNGFDAGVPCLCRNFSLAHFQVAAHHDHHFGFIHKLYSPFISYNIL